MAELPLHLAGPVVRRVEPSKASFWIALSKPATVTASVWPGVHKSVRAEVVEGGQGPVASGRTTTRAFGANLHVALVTAAIPATAPNPPLTPGIDPLLRHPGLRRGRAQGHGLARRPSR